MTTEKPTADLGGASIEARIERHLAAQDEPLESKEPATEPETPEATEAPAEDAQAENEPQIELSALAKVLGVDDAALDVDESGAVFVKTKIDGKEGAAKFVDLVKSYQLQGHVDAKAREAAAREQHLEQETRERIQHFARIGQVAEQEMMREFASINWQELAQHDPAEYVAKKAAFEARQAQIGQLFGELNATNERMIERSRAAAAQYIAEHIPGWSPGNAIDVEMTKYVTSIGLSNVAPLLAQAPQLAVLIHKARLFDEASGKAVAAVKKVATAPKLVKPGQSVSARDRAAEGVSAIKEKIRKSGGKDGIAEFLMASGKV